MQLLQLLMQGQVAEQKQGLQALRTLTAWQQPEKRCLAVQKDAVCGAILELISDLAAKLPEQRHLVDNLCKDPGCTLEQTSQTLMDIWQVSPISFEDSMTKFLFRNVVPVSPDEVPLPCIHASIFLVPAVRLGNSLGQNGVGGLSMLLVSNDCYQS